jgi:DNA-binding SARP family transcriptional activator
VPEFRILGPLEVAAADGEPLQLGGQKQRALLAVLLLHANEVVSTDFLVDALWGDHPPRTATTSLQNSISALRKLLGADLLVTRAPGYRLAVDPDSIDLVRFERLVASARGLEPAERAAPLREALGLWRGAPLAEVAFEPFALAEARRLEELRLSAFEALFDAELAAGRAGEIVPELESLVARHPLRERLRGQLMVALYGTGRQADALAAYQEARRMLVDELGLEPGPQLQELHARILRQEVPRPRPAHDGIDDDHFRDVGEALLAGRLVPVLGAELDALAAHIAHRFDYPADEARELTRVAQFVALTKGAGPLYDELRGLLAASGEPSPVHRFFASLPPLLRDRGAQQQLLVTTSYDLALEQAFLDAGEEIDVVSYIASGRDRGRFAHLGPDGTSQVIDLPNTYASQLSLERRTVILKLHGGLDVESFVVTEDDYIGYHVAGSIPVGIAAKLSRSHLLFLGYGMRDWSLRLVLSRTVGDAHAYRSWAVVPQVRPLERQLWRARDVDLLEQPLDEYVHALARYVGAEAPA